MVPDRFNTDIIALPPVRLRRKITGMSAILLPFTELDTIDWEAFEGHVARTAQCGLVPAVNMDTGYASLIDPSDRRMVLERTRAVLGQGSFVAGAYVADQPGDAFNFDGYREAIEEIERFSGTPVIYQSYGLAHGPSAQIVDAYGQIARHCQRFIAFELGTQFAPFGCIYDLATYEQLIQIPACIGAKHSSLRRLDEWARLELRDRVRPEFLVLTGNDLAIDMVMYGSDYLLGLSTFGPDWFARRDALWLAGDARFFELNDLLHYLGFFAFREPVPAYRHSAAQMLMIRNWAAAGRTHPQSPHRPDTDEEVLRQIAQQIDACVAGLS